MASTPSITPSNEMLSSRKGALPLFAAALSEFLDLLFHLLFYIPKQHIVQSKGLLVSLILKISSAYSTGH